MKTAGYLTKELVTRGNQYSFFSHIGMMPNPDRILKRTGKTIEAYRDLKNDAHVWSCIQSRKSGLLGLETNIVQGNTPQAVFKVVEEFINSLDINRISREILDAPLYGWQPMEIIWSVGGKNPKYIFPSDVIAKPQEWFFFDPDGELRIREQGQMEGTLPTQMKIICVRYEASYQNPYGDALLGKCYWPVTFKNGGLRFWVNFMEKYGMPILLGQYTRGASAEESRTLAEQLSTMSEDAVIVAPSDIEIKLHEAGRISSVNLYKELIKLCNAEISKALLSQTLTTELDMGSYAASMTHYKVRQEVIRADIKLVEYVFNTLIKYIVDINFGGYPYPLFRIIMNDSDNLQKVERDIKLVQSGMVKFSRNYWMQTYGLKEEDLD